MSINIIGDALDELYKAFDILNRDKFDSSLPLPVITMQRLKGNVYGHFTINKVWINKDDTENETYHEINIDPRWFQERKPDEIIGTLLHEMVHYFNKINNIKDCSGKIHNKKFKEKAESVGLIVEKSKSCGYGITSLSNELKKYIAIEINPIETVFKYYCKNEGKEQKPKNKRIFNYVCPHCGQTVKGKEFINIKCGNCDIPMKMLETKTEIDNKYKGNKINGDNEN